MPKLSTLTYKGFTLIELLIVITIIGILVSLVSTSFITAQKQARDGSRKTDLEQIRQALESYRSEWGIYPDTTTELAPDYISVVPVDPKDGIYAYEDTDGGTYYNLCAALEIDQDEIPNACDLLSCGTRSCNYLKTAP